MVVSKFCHCARAIKLNARGKYSMSILLLVIYITYKSDTLTTIMSGLKFAFNHMKFL